MNVNSEGGLDITELEGQALALAVTARQLEAFEDWLQWEDYPNLSETAFEDLVGRVANQANVWRERSRMFDRTYDIDSAHIIEATS